MTCCMLYSVEFIKRLLQHLMQHLMHRMGFNETTSYMFLQWSGNSHQIVLRTRISIETL
jgi:hypothetical protein